MPAGTRNKATSLERAVGLPGRHKSWSRCARQKTFRKCNIKMLNLKITSVATFLCNKQNKCWFTNCSSFTVSDCLSTALLNVLQLILYRIITISRRSKKHKSREQRKTPEMQQSITQKVYRFILSRCHRLTPPSFCNKKADMDLIRLCGSQMNISAAPVHPPHTEMEWNDGR